jgi:hypothetical protein
LQYATNFERHFLELSWKFHNLDSFKDAILPMPQKFLALLFFSGGQGFEAPFPFRGRGGVRVHTFVTTKVASRALEESKSR